MAYKYFTEQALNPKYNLDLANIFPERQKIVQENSNVSYNLLDIAYFIKANTNNFKSSEQRYIDLDDAMRTVVFRYYTSQNMTNPFIGEEDDILKSEDEESISMPDSGIVVGKSGVQQKPSIVSPAIKTPEQAKAEDKKEKKTETIDNSEQSLIDEWSSAANTIIEALKEEDEEEGTYPKELVSEWKEALSALVEGLSDLESADKKMIKTYKKYLKP